MSKQQDYDHPWMNFFSEALKTASGQTWFRIFYVSFVSFVCTSVLTVEDRQASGRWGDLLDPIVKISLLATIISFFALATQTIGMAAGKKSFGSQARHVVVRIGLYLFLPALIIALLLTLVVIPLVRQ
jgi:hypothetical protein